MQFESTINGEVFNVYIDTSSSVASIGTDTYDYKIIHHQNGRMLLRSGTNVYKIDNIAIDAGQVSFTLNGTLIEASVKDEQLLLLEKLGFKSGPEKMAGELNAPMPGKVLEVMVHEGDNVEEGQPVLILEAMKMENEIKAPIAGTITSLQTMAGESVEKNHNLLVITPRG